jgi:hypothetical protein
VIHKSPSTVIKDRQILRHHLLPAFGTRKLFEIRRRDVRDFKATLCNERRLAAQTVNNILGLCHKIFDSAVSEDELIGANCRIAFKLTR